jgi:hypothetical protein
MVNDCLRAGLRNRKAVDNRMAGTAVFDGLGLWLFEICQSKQVLDR